MKCRWLLAPTQPSLAVQLAAELKISSLLAQCLLNRGFCDAGAMARFLQPRLKQLADPFLLPHMDAAVDRLYQARQRGERLVIFGDYDVDGVTSTALLVEVMRGLGWTVDYYLPHRIEEGYGLSQEAVQNCVRKLPAPLLLAVDCGSTAAQSIAWLKEQGTDVIVLDHHQVSNPPPAALAIVNPHLASPPAGPGPGPAAPSSGHEGRGAFTELCSVGLSFKLAHALVKRGRQTGLPGAEEYDLRPLLDLVSLGTIADIVPLVGENRILVSAGLERLNATQRPGLVALKQVAQCPAPLGAYEVGFQLAPRLNAAGRLETAEESLNLLLARGAAEATPLAQRLDARNRERQQIERSIAEEAIGLVRGKFQPEQDLVIVEGQLHWHIGVVGIVAARVLQQFYRPTIIVGGDGAEWRGSGRSIAGFDLAAALRQCGDLLVRSGGHAMAAGLAIQPGNLDAFRARLNGLARAALPPDALQPPLRLDAEIGLDRLTLAELHQLDQLAPVGQGNPAVQFCARNLVQHRPAQRIGGEKHVKMWVTDGRRILEAVWWGGGNQPLPAGRFDLAFAPSINEYYGQRTVQLKVLDWRDAG